MRLSWPMCSVNIVLGRCIGPILILCSPGRKCVPPWPDTMLADYLKPAAVRAGIGAIGWHTFRRSYATLLHYSSPSLVVQKELLRHGDMVTTLNIYTQAVPASLPGSRPRRRLPRCGKTDLDKVGFFSGRAGCG